MNHLPVSQEAWKQIVYWSRRYTGVRVMNVTWIAVYLFCYHLLRYEKQRSFHQRMAMAMAACVMFTTVLLNQRVTVRAEQISDELENEFTPIASVAFAVENPDGLMQSDVVVSKGYEENLEFHIILTNDGNVDLTNVTIENLLLPLYLEDKDGVRIPIDIHEDDLIEGGNSENESVKDVPEGTQGENLENVPEGTQGENLENVPEGTQDENLENVPEDTQNENIDDESADNEPEEDEAVEETDDEQAEDEATADSDNEQAGDESNVDITTLAVGESILLVTSIPIGYDVGEKNDQITVRADELVEEVQIPLHIVIQEGDSSGEGENIPPEDNLPEEPSDIPSDVPSDIPVEEDAQERPDDDISDIPTEDTSIDNSADAPPEDTSIDNSADTPQEDTSIDNSADTSSEDTSDEMTADEPDYVVPESPTIEDPVPPQLNILDTQQGYFIGNTFFAAHASKMTMKFELGNQIAVSQLACVWENQTEYLDINDGNVEWSIPEQMDAMVSFGYFDDSDTFVELQQVYVVNESGAPTLSCDINKNDSQKIDIFIEENGEVKSGINEALVSVDGVNMPVDQMEERISVEKAVLASGQMVQTAVYTGALLPIGEHEVVVSVSDNNNNITTQKFYLLIRPNDVICMVLPTTFYLGIREADVDTQIYSDDIVIQNKSECAVDVSITQVEIQVDKTVPNGSVMTGMLNADSADVYELPQVAKGCNITMNVGTDSGVLGAFELPEGLSENVFDFCLESQNSGYVNFRGNLYDNNAGLWEDGDLKIIVIFNFTKHIDENDVSRIMVEE